MKPESAGAGGPSSEGRAAHGEPPHTFVERHTVHGAAPLVPEIRLHVAADVHGIFAEASAHQGGARAALPPYWAFAWPGGQAVARYILDNPGLVAGRSVVDIGAGSGIAAIAAVMAGARQVTAADIDSLAIAAIELNARANGLEGRIRTTERDLLGGLPDAEIILISDLVYDPELRLRVGAFLERAGRAGRPLVIGDRLSARRPAVRLLEVARYDVPLFPALSDEEVAGARVWREGPAPRRGGARSGKALP